MMLRRRVFLVVLPCLSLVYLLTPPHGRVTWFPQFCVWGMAGVSADVW